MSEPVHTRLIVGQIGRSSNTPQSTNSHHWSVLYDCNLSMIFGFWNVGERFRVIGLTGDDDTRAWMLQFQLWLDYVICGLWFYQKNIQPPLVFRKALFLGHFFFLIISNLKSVLPVRPRIFSETHLWPLRGSLYIIPVLRRRYRRCYRRSSVTVLSECVRILGKFLLFEVLRGSFCHYFKFSLDWKIWFIWTNQFWNWLHVVFRW